MTITIPRPDFSSFFSCNAENLDEVHPRVHLSVRPRVKRERQIAEKVIQCALKKGYLLSVFDGEEITLRKSTNPLDILYSLSTTDEDFLMVYTREGTKIGWVKFVYGNDGWDVISDYTSSDLMEDLLTPVLRLTATLAMRPLR